MAVGAAVVAVVVVVVAAMHVARVTDEDCPDAGFINNSLGAENTNTQTDFSSGAPCCGHMCIRSSVSK